MASSIRSVQENTYDIFIEDADGRRLCLDTLPDLRSARQRLKALAASYPQMRLILRCHKTQAILAETDGY